MSTIDELQRLHEAATPGKWRHEDGDIYLDWIKSEDGHMVLSQCDITAMDIQDIKSVVALHNAWPAIHRVLVAAREFADRRNKQADTFHQWAELWQALRALDDKEQRT